MVTKVLLVRQQHFAKLSRERVRPCWERKRQRNKTEKIDKHGVQLMVLRGPRFPEPKNCFF
jgi:hypothetical protein